MKSLNDYEIIPKVLSIRTNLNHIHYFSFGYINEIARNNYKSNDDYLINATFIAKDKIDIPVLKECEKYEWFYFHNKYPHSIFFVHPFPIKKNLIMKVTLKDDKIEVECEKFYYNAIKFKIENVLPPGCHLFNLIMALLISKDFYIFHASSIEFQNNSYIFMAPSNTGKSYTAYSLINKIKAKIFSEDLTPIDANLNLYANVLMSVHSKFIRNFYSISENIVTKALKKTRDILSLCPFIPIYQSSNTSYFTDFYKQGYFADHAPLKTVFIISWKKPNKIDRISCDEAFKYMLSLNRLEFGYYKDPLIYAIDNFLLKLNVHKLMKTKEKFIDRIAKTIPVYKINFEDHEYLLKSIIRVIEGKNYFRK